MSYQYLVHHYLRDSAARSPDQLAVVDAKGSYTYAELDERSDRIAALLHRLGVRRGDRVGIYLRKSREAVAGIYGAMKAGAVYVPLDPSAPESRIGFIADNCGIRHILTGKEKRRAWSKVIDAGAPIEHLVVLNDQSNFKEVGGAVVHNGVTVAESSRDFPDPETNEQDLAWILYTSGSTGDPKGVMLSHGNGRGFVDWAVVEFGVTAADRVSSHAPLHFDLSTFDLYAAAKAGAPVYLVPPMLSVFPVEIIRFINDHQINVWYSVPSILTMMIEHGDMDVGALPSLRTLLFAGEVFPTKYLSRMMRLLPHVDFANLYGPTETNVCTYYRVPEPPDEMGPTISIGRAIANVETFILDDAGVPVAEGQTGELFVRGLTVMKGYWGDPARTAARLSPSPLWDHHGDPVYRTGDLVEEQADGNYRFLGRRDNQIKSRGYRIELGDIETALHAHPAILECAVIAVPDELVSNRIHAFVQLRADATDDEIISFCADLIPRYMIPESFERLDAIPKTSTGKIDRQSLGSRARGEVTAQGSRLR